MPPAEPSPWITSAPSGGKGRAPKLRQDGSARFFIGQPLWFRVPAIVLAVIAIAGGFVLARSDPAAPSGLVTMGLGLAIGIGLLVVAHTGRLIVEPRGIAIRLIAADEFVPFSRVSSVRVAQSGVGRYRETYLEISLTFGDPVIVHGADEAARVAILTARAAWEDSRGDQPRPNATPGEERGPYRGRKGPKA